MTLGYLKVALLSVCAVGLISNQFGTLTIILTLEILLTLLTLKSDPSAMSIQHRLFGKEYLIYLSTADNLVLNQSPD